MYNIDPGFNPDPHIYVISSANVNSESYEITAENIELLACLCSKDVTHSVPLIVHRHRLGYQKKVQSLGRG